MSGHEYYLMERRTGLQWRVPSIERRASSPGERREGRYCRPHTNTETRDERLCTRRPVYCRCEEKVVHSPPCGDGVYRDAAFRWGNHQPQKRDKDRQYCRQSRMGHVFRERPSRDLDRADCSGIANARGIERKGEAQHAASGRNSCAKRHRWRSRTCSAVRSKPHGNPANSSEQTLAVAMSEWPEDLRVREWPEAMKETK